MKFILLMIVILFTGSPAQASAKCLACASPPMPKIDVSIWAADSASASIVRAQEQRGIACREPAFDQYSCMTYEDLKKIYSTLLKCKKWSDVVDEDRAQVFIQRNEDLHRSILQVKPRDPGEKNPLDKEPGQEERRGNVVSWQEVL